MNEYLEEAENLLRLIDNKHELTENLGREIFYKKLAKLLEWCEEHNTLTPDIPTVFYYEDEDGENVEDIWYDHIACSDDDCIDDVLSGIPKEEGLVIKFHEHDSMYSSNVYYCNCCGIPVTNELDYVDNELYHYNHSDFKKEELTENNIYELYSIVYFLCNYCDFITLQECRFVCKFYNLIFET